MSDQQLCDPRTAVLEYARLRFHTCTDWLSYVQDVKKYCIEAMGADEARRFFQEVAFREVHGMIAELAMQRASIRPTRVITVRMPRELHDALKDEARRRSTTLNRLCIAKLLGSIGGDSTGVLLAADPASIGVGRG